MKYIFYSFCLFFVFLTASFYIYHSYQLEKKFQSIKYVTKYTKYYPEELLFKIGYHFTWPKNRKSHFLNFPNSKPQKTIRIGAFGDSFTYGSEVGYGQSYPTQLQELFDSHFPNKKIEVLNFGVSGHGLSQQFFIWDFYHIKYELDYILYGPKGLYSYRNVSFKMYSPLPIERFILLKNQKLKTVVIKGETAKEKFQNYYSLLPSFNALRYDRYPFQTWEQYFPFLKGKIKNPFYYSSLSIDEEASSINKILLEKINNKYDRKFILLQTNNYYYDLYKSIQKTIPLRLIPEFSKKFPYKMYSHNSTLRNELTAQFYFHALIGEQDFELDIINCYTQKKNFLLEKLDIDLKQVSKIQIGTKHLLLGDVNFNSSNYHYVKSKAPKVKSNIKSFLYLSKSNFIKGILFPIPIALSKESQLYIKAGNKKIILGTINSMDASGKIFYFSKDYILRKKTHSSYKKYTYEIYLKNKDIPLSSSLSLFVGNYKLGNLVLRSSKTKYKDKNLFYLNYTKKFHEDSFLIMGPNFQIRHKDLPSKFSLYFYYIMKDDTRIKSLIPEWSCQKEKRGFHLPLDSFDPIPI